MKLFGYEFRKLIGIRYFVILLVLLMIASGILCYFRVKDEGVGKFGANAADEVNAFLKEYADKPEELKEQVQFLSMKAGEKATLRYEAYRKEMLDKGMDEESIPWYFDALKKHPDWAYTYNYSETVPDTVLAEIGPKVLENKEKYNSGMATILRQAKSNAQRLEEDEGMDMGDYLYYYQAQVYLRYAKVLENASVGDRYVSGWTQFFEYRYGDFFLFGALILLCCMVFVPEKQCGMLPILRTARKGRIQVACAKVSLLLLSSAVLALVFAAIHFFVIFCACGYSSFSDSVQNIPSLLLFPKAWTMGQYLAYSVLLKVLAAVAFSAAAGFLSALTYSPVLSYLGGAAIFGGSFGMSFMDVGQHPFYHCLNFYSMENVAPIAERLHMVQIFNSGMEYILFAPLLCLGCTVLFALPTVALVSGVRMSGRTKAAERQSVFKRLKKSLLTFENSLRTKMAKKSKEKRKIYRVGLVRWENRKQFLWNVPVLLLTAILFGVQIFVSFRAADNGTPSLEYRVYTHFLLSEARGPYSQQAEKYDNLINIYTKGDEGRQILSEDYRDGRIDRETYERYTEYLRTIRNNLGTYDFRTAREHYDLLKSMNESGLDPWFIDYLSWSRLLTGKISYPLFACILVVAILTFTVEYTGKSKAENFANILRCTKLGRKKTFLAKCLSILCICFVLALLFWGVEYIFMLRSGNFPDIDAPLCSLPVFSQASGGITIRQYLIFSLAARVLSAMLTGLFVTAVSALTRNIFSGLTVSVAVTMIPTLLYMAGMNGAGYISFGSWFGVNEMIQFSMKNDLFGWDFGVYALYTGIFAAVTVLLLAAARKKFIK